MTCSVCSDPTITNDAQCTACTSTMSPTYAVTCTTCTTGWEIQGGVCVQVCLTPDTSNSAKCKKCVSGYFLDSKGKCVKTCPSDTTANSQTGVCDANPSETPAEDTCERSGNLCVKRIYWSWMTIVVGVINGALIVALGVHLLTSVFGTTFMGAA